jgi:hypothetical protein
MIPGRRFVRASDHVTEMDLVRDGWIGIGDWCAKHGLHLMHDDARSPFINSILNDRVADSIITHVARLLHGMRERGDWPSSDPDLPEMRVFEQTPGAIIVIAREARR